MTQERDDYMQAQDAHHDMIAMRDPDHDAMNRMAAAKRAKKFESDVQEISTALDDKDRRIDELEDALSALMRRLDNHFGGPGKSGDWKQQERAREVLGWTGEAQNK